MAQSFGLGMQELWDSSQLSGGSAAWLEALYENYLRDPISVDAEWREFFDRLPKATNSTGSIEQCLSFPWSSAGQNQSAGYSTERKY